MLCWIAPETITPDQARHLAELWRMSRAYASTRHARMLWSVRRFVARYPSVSHTGAYKYLDRMLPR